jgi:hypothetical protein
MYCSIWTKDGFVPQFSLPLTVAIARRIQTARRDPPCSKALFRLERKIRNQPQKTRKGKDTGRRSGTTTKGEKERSVHDITKLYPPASFPKHYPQRESRPCIA